MPDGIHHLDEEESRHAIKVLRLGKGDRLNITDGKGIVYQCEVTTLSGKLCHFSVVNETAIPKRKHYIHIAIAPTKNLDRIEWFVEKATEIGIDEITFLKCEKSERKVVNLERLYKKAISAIKQSGQAWLPDLNPLTQFENALDFLGSKFIGHVDGEISVHLKNIKSGDRSMVLIGPEGDFSPGEIQLAVANGFQPISLGPSILRTETAGIAACHILNLINT